NKPIPEKNIACYYTVPPYRTPKKFDSEKEPVNITADYVSGKMVRGSQHLSYSGNVVILQGDREVYTDTADYDESSREITINGKSLISAPEYTTATEEEVKHNIDTGDLEMTNTKFQINGSVYSGTAEKQETNSKTGLKVFKRSTISTCPTDSQTWHIWSSSIVMEKDASFGSSWNDVLFLGDVPVFYTPYANFPITNKRRSGLLPVTVSYKIGSGASYEAPIYLNLAPNYDATLTPGYDDEHGQIYQAEFRFLPFKNVRGEINGTYLPEDPLFYPSNNKKERWFINIKENMYFLNHDLTVDVDFSKVRNDDYTYLSDISQKDVAISDSSLLKTIKTEYNRNNYNISAELRKYQNMYSVTSDNTYRPFAMLPQIKASYYDTYGRFDYRIDTEATRFNLDKMKQDDVNLYRYHAEPQVQYHVYDGYGTNVDVGGRLFLTHYSQEDLKYMPTSGTYRQRLGYDKYSDSVNRALYLVEGKAKTTLERKFLDMRHTQTLEPEIKYQYIPYRDQNNIALYDTTSRYDDFYTLFSYNKYAGIDRIANINAVTAGFSSRILDPHDREILRFSIAQAYNFSDNKVKLYQTDTLSTNPRSPIEATIDANPISQINLHAALQYDPSTTKVNTYNAYVKYNDSTGFMAAVSYRYFRLGNYLLEDWSQVDLKQLGMEMSFPITSKLKIFGASYKDIEQSYNIDSKIGIKYDECCYAITLAYENYMNVLFNERKHTPEKIIGLQFDLKGLYSVKMRGTEVPDSTGTHYLPSLDPVNLNR
ncbi:MAG: LPS-assembly protein LptD, partial [Succinivibrio sp.]